MPKCQAVVGAQDWLLPPRAGGPRGQTDCHSRGALRRKLCEGICFGKQTLRRVMLSPKWADPLLGNPQHEMFRWYFLQQTLCYRPAQHDARDNSLVPERLAQRGSSQNERCPMAGSAFYSFPPEMCYSVDWIRPACYFAVLNSRSSSVFFLISQR
jgi:hypothetical protein